MVTGKTGERTQVSGHYYCEHHPTVETYFEEGDEFSRCRMDEQDTKWNLKKNEPSGTSTTDDPATEAPQKPTEDATAKTSPEETEKIKSTDAYKRKGFLAALNSQYFHAAPEFKLDSIIREERAQTDHAIYLLKEQHQKKMDILKGELDYLKQLLDEKIHIKKEYTDKVKKLELEYNQIQTEIAGYYKQLKDELISLGTGQEDLITKRINRYDAEINQIVTIHEKLEEKQGAKFAKDFKARDLSADDKRFVLNYRQKMEESFNDVEQRIRGLERDGLNLVIANFLIPLGWLSAFISSWFFAEWNSKTQPSNQNNTSLITYILDNLRYLALHYDWWVSSLVFVGYLATIMAISKYCYKWQLAGKFSKDDEADGSIEFSTEDDNLLKSQFKAKNWFELWLKITPFLSSILLLIVILAIGSKFAPHEHNTYRELSDALSRQTTGLLLPVAFTVIFFLYITRIIEPRLIRRYNDDKSHAAYSWEIPLLAIFFVALIGLLIMGNMEPYKELNLIGPWGFFIGCICTGFSLGYGYRFIALYESFSVLVYRIQSVNRYIDKNFYPSEVSILKAPSVLDRMVRLYHSLLNLVESRNSLAVRLLNPYFRVNKEKYNQKEADNDNQENKKAPDKEKITQDGNTTKYNPVLNFISGIIKKVAAAYDKIIKKKNSIIAKLKKELEDLKENKLDVDILTYFPESAAKITEIKNLISKREEAARNIEKEIRGYYTNEETYGKIEKQTAFFYKRQSTLTITSTNEEKNHANAVKVIEMEYLIKKTCIEEGYYLGIWYTKQTHLN